MQYDHLLVRYGELTLKGTNRKMFINQLKDNVKRALIPLSGYHVKGKRDRMYIELSPEADINEIIQRLSKVYGIKSISPVIKIDKNEEKINQSAIQLSQDFEKGSTFKVDVKRVDKSFRLDTYELQRQVGGAILKENNNITVNVKNPDYEIKIEVRMDAIYIYEKVIAGAGGLPVGTGGKTLLMLSGGIDSPVAGIEVMKRGVTVEAIHFHSPPFTSEKAKDKVIELTRILAERVGPFTEIQKQINKVVHPRYTMTSTRRMMMRISDKVVHQINANAIVNGENLGQVASQTLKSMYAINHVTATPVLRPLLTLDKEDIIKKAKELGTFETSIQPYEDCCTIFTPKNPVTEPDFDKVVKYESVFNFDEMIENAVENIETLTIDQNYKSAKEQSTDSLIKDLF